MRKNVLDCQDNNLVVISAGWHVDSIHISPCTDNAYTNTWYAATSLINITT
jgi:hypothetical protein